MQYQRKLQIDDKKYFRNIFVCSSKAITALVENLYAFLKVFSANDNNENMEEIKIIWENSVIRLVLISVLIPIK